MTNYNDFLNTPWQLSEHVFLKKSYDGHTHLLDSKNDELYKIDGIIGEFLVLLDGPKTLKELEDKFPDLDFEDEEVLEELHALFQELVENRFIVQLKK